jgi:hypothetical protein
MREPNKSFMDATDPQPLQAAQLPRSALRFTPPPARPLSFGFSLPVLVVCAALWLLLNGI